MTEMGSREIADARVRQASRTTRDELIRCRRLANLSTESRKGVTTMPYDNRYLVTVRLTDDPEQSNLVAEFKSREQAESIAVSLAIGNDRSGVYYSVYDRDDRRIIGNHYTKGE